MTELHPDKQQHQTDKDQHDSDGPTASEVTHAYKTISHPQKRATHLLELNGTAIDENDTGNLVGNEFLFTIMETRESIEDILHSDSDNDEVKDNKLRPILTHNQDLIEETCQHLITAFQSNDLKEAKKLTAQLQYWYRVEETIIDKISSIH